jgi:hypothetical protein
MAAGGPRKVGTKVRIWLSFPRILGGFVRPGISFNLSELTRLLRRGHVVLRREDIVVSRKRSQGMGISI